MKVTCLLCNDKLPPYVDQTNENFKLGAAESKTLCRVLNLPRDEFEPQFVHLLFCKRCKNVINFSGVLLIEVEQLMERIGTIRSELHEKLLNIFLSDDTEESEEGLEYAEGTFFPWEVRKLLFRSLKFTTFNENDIQSEEEVPVPTPNAVTSNEEHGLEVITDTETESPHYADVAEENGLHTDEITDTTEGATEPSTPIADREQVQEVLTFSTVPPIAQPFQEVDASPLFFEDDDDIDATTQPFQEVDASAQFFEEQGVDAATQPFQVVDASTQYFEDQTINATAERFQGHTGVLTVAQTNHEQTVSTESFEPLDGIHVAGHQSLKEKVSIDGVPVKITAQVSSVLSAIHSSHEEEEDVEDSIATHEEDIHVPTLVFNGDVQSSDGVIDSTTLSSPEDVEVTTYICLVDIDAATQCTNEDIDAATQCANDEFDDTTQCSNDVIVAATGEGVYVVTECTDEDIDSADHLSHEDTNAATHPYDEDTDASTQRSDEDLDTPTQRSDEDTDATAHSSHDSIIAATHSSHEDAVATAHSTHEDIDTASLSVNENISNVVDHLCNETTDIVETNPFEDDVLSTQPSCEFDAVEAATGDENDPQPPGMGERAIYRLPTMTTIPIAVVSTPAVSNTVTIPNRIRIKEEPREEERAIHPSDLRPVTISVFDGFASEPEPEFPWSPPPVSETSGKDKTQDMIAEDTTSKSTSVSTSSNSTKKRSHPKKLPVLKTGGTNIESPMKNTSTATKRKMPLEEQDEDNIPLLKRLKVCSPKVSSKGNNASSESINSLTPQTLQLETNKRKRKPVKDDSTNTTPSGNFAPKTVNANHSGKHGRPKTAHLEPPTKVGRPKSINVTPSEIIDPKVIGGPSTSKVGRLRNSNTTVSEKVGHQSANVTPSGRFGRPRNSNVASYDEDGRRKNINVTPSEKSEPKIVAASAKVGRLRNSNPVVSDKIVQKAVISSSTGRVGRPRKSEIEGSRKSEVERSRKSEPERSRKSQGVGRSRKSEDVERNKSIHARPNEKMGKIAAVVSAKIGRLRNLNTPVSEKSGLQTANVTQSGKVGRPRNSNIISDVGRSKKINLNHSEKSESKNVASSSAAKAGRIRNSNTNASDKVGQKSTSVKSSGKQIYTCKACAKDFGKSSHLTRHITHVHNKEHSECFVCPACQKSFTTKSFLDLHIRTHAITKDTKFLCEICGMSYKVEKSLQAHRKTHENSRNIQLLCTLCGDKFDSRAGLKLHVKNHSK